MKTVGFHLTTGKSRKEPDYVLYRLVPVEAIIFMNLANKLTIIRIILTFIFMVFLSFEGIFTYFCAMIVFFIASITDYYDGRIARQRQEVTDFGKIMDPIADKILTLGAFLVFVEKNLIPSWMVIIIVGRELLVTSVRFLFARKKEIISADITGKHKTTIQVCTIFYVLFILLLKEIFQKLDRWPAGLEFWLFQVILYTLMLGTIIITLSSGILFLKRNIKIK
ncbi:MAG: CDP-diacylglycerol--glycerol-3-phosphate 3-phosphatidyltransferase [Candidatus Omnitrophota bacterium]